MWESSYAGPASSCPSLRLPGGTVCETYRPPPDNIPRITLSHDIPRSPIVAMSQGYISAPQRAPCLPHPYSTLVITFDTRQRQASCLLWGTCGHSLPLDLRLGWGQGAGGKGQGRGLCSCSQLNSGVVSTELRNPGQCRAGQFYKQLQKILSHTLEAQAGETLAGPA